MNEEQYIKIETWLKSIDLRLTSIEKSIVTNPSSPPTITFNLPVGIEKLAHYLKSTPEDILNILSFDADGEFTFLFEIDGNSEPDKQLRATLCILTVSYYCFAKEEMSSKNLIQKLQFWGIKSLSHISHSLKKHNRLIVAKGIAGSSNFSYKITVPGLNEGTKILSGFINHLREG